MCCTVTLGFLEMVRRGVLRAGAFFAGIDSSSCVVMMIADMIAPASEEVNQQAVGEGVTARGQRTTRLWNVTKSSAGRFGEPPGATNHWGRAKRRQDGFGVANAGILRAGAGAGALRPDDLTR